MAISTLKAAQTLRDRIKITTYLGGFFPINLGAPAQHTKLFENYSVK